MEGEAMARTVSKADYVARSSSKPSRGRPKGATTGNTVVVETIPAGCPHCGCTRRKSLRIVREREIGGVSPAGHPRTHIVWRRCQCDSCHGYFTEMAHENRPAEETSAEAS